MVKGFNILALKVLNNRIRRNALLTNLLFGVKAEGNERIYWDFTTLALKSSLRERVTPGSRVLEIGTGPFAILSLFIKHRFDCDVTAVDINPRYVTEAIDTARGNGLSINLLQSDLFEHIPGRFDVIFFNSIYIPRNTGRKLGIDALHRLETDWCGGEDGLETIDRFLAGAASHLERQGQVLLGFNTAYLKRSAVAGLCRKYGYHVEFLSRRPLNPSVVAILKQEEEL